MHSSERDLSADLLPKLRSHSLWPSTFLLAGTTLCSHMHTVIKNKCTAKPRISKNAFSLTSLSLSSWFGNCLVNIGAVGIPHHPQEHVSQTHEAPLLGMVRFVYWQEGSEGALPPWECFSGVGRGASSRPHHWHSCPCSAHNSLPTSPSLVIPLLICVWFPLWLLINA